MNLTEVIIYHSSSFKFHLHKYFDEWIDVEEAHKLAKAFEEKLKKVFNHGQYILGPEVLELENKLSILTNSNKCLAVSSGTDALIISLMALGIKKGDEIITTVFSYISTVEVIVRLGAIPIMVDINENDCNINENLIDIIWSK